MIPEALGMEDVIKKALVIQSVNAFVAGVIFIILPLFMVEKSIPVETIGLIFAVMPIFMQAFRLVFGILSDYVGRKIFYWLDGIFNIAAPIFYLLSNNPLVFLAGKMSEGIRDASLWSVNRAYFIDHSADKEAALIKLRGVDSALGALGMLLAGFMVVLLLFDRTWLLLILISLIVFPEVKLMHDVVKFREKLDLHQVVKALDFRKKKKKFKNFIIIFTLLGLSWGFVTGYILPVFLQSKGVPIEDIGLLLGARALCNAAILYLFQKLGSGKVKVLAGGLLFSFVLAILAIFSSSGMANIFALVILMGAVGGIADAGYETIFVSIADHNFIGRDIGILMIGLQVGQSLTQAASGFVIAYLGFPAMFFMAAMLYATYTLAAYKNLCVKDE
jgi:MFS family permease